MENGHNKNILLEEVVGIVSGLGKFENFLQSLRDRYKNKIWPKVGDVRKILHTKEECLFSFFEDDQDEMVAALASFSFQLESGARGFYGLCLVVDLGFCEKPIGSEMINKLKEDFDIIAFHAEPFGYKNDLREHQIQKLKEKLIGYYEVLGFLIQSKEFPSFMKWEKEKNSKETVVKYTHAYR